MQIWFILLMVTLRSAIDSGTLHVRGEDAANLSFLSDGSVDRVLGMNVIYFLNPLEDYLRSLFTSEQFSLPNEE